MENLNELPIGNLDELSFDNIQDEDTDLEGLFTDESDDVNNNEDKDKKEAAEISPEDLFGGSEGVGSEDDSGDEDASSDKDKSNSPNFYSSIATALREDGILPDITDEDLKVTSPEEFGP